MWLENLREKGSAKPRYNFIQAGTHYVFHYTFIAALLPVCYFITLGLRPIWPHRGSFRSLHLGQEHANSGSSSESRWPHFKQVRRFLPSGIMILNPSPSTQYGQRRGSIQFFNCTWSFSRGWIVPKAIWFSSFSSSLPRRF